jgi:uncharacterized protein (TIGR03083 family)
MTRLSPARYADHLVADTERMAQAFERGPTDAPVAACPGWDVSRLVEHMSFIHRWATWAILHRRAPERGDVEHRPDGVDPAQWLRQGGRRLVDALGEVDSDGPTWHVFPFERSNWVWGRRQAQETAMHRWDAEMATSGTSSLDAVLASDGIQEYFELVVPRVVERDGAAAPASSLHVHCEDVAGEWFVTADDDGVHVVNAHRKGDAALRGTAERLLLVLMQRSDVGAIEIVGDRTAADAWLGLPGL